MTKHTQLYYRIEHIWLMAPKSYMNNSIETSWTQSMDSAKKDVSGKTNSPWEVTEESTVGSPSSITVTQWWCVVCDLVETCLRSQDNEELARWRNGERFYAKRIECQWHQHENFMGFWKNDLVLLKIPWEVGWCLRSPMTKNLFVLIKLEIIPWAMDTHWGFYI